MPKNILSMLGIAVLALAVWKITGGDIGGLLSNILAFVLNVVNVASDWVVDIWNTANSN